MMVKSEEMNVLMSDLEKKLPRNAVILLAVSVDDGDSIQVITNGTCLRCVCESLFVHSQHASHKGHSIPDATGFSVN